MRRRPVLLALTVVYLLAVAAITLTPQPADAPQSHIIRDAIAALARLPLFGWVTYDGVEFTANIAMFLPMGVLLTLLLDLRRWWLVLLIGVAATCSIELAQSAMPTRVSDVRDIVANALGTLIGIGIVAAFASLRRGIPRRPSRTQRASDSSADANSSRAGRLIRY